MSVIHNKFSNVGAPGEDYQAFSHDNNGFIHKQSYDNNNTPRIEKFYMSNVDYGNVQDNKPTFFFWTLVVFLFILALGNLILTFVILGVLRLGQGMESLELVSEDNLIKLYGITDLDAIFKPDGHLEGFGDKPMEVVGDIDSVLIRLNKHGNVAPSIDIGIDRETVQVDSFEVRDPLTNVPIFTTNYPNFGLPRGVVKLDVQKAQTKRIASAIGSNLSVRSETVVKLKGSEGTRMEGQEVIWTADQEIFLKSVNKSIILSGNEGIFIDIKRIPIAYINEDTRPQYQFKMCVCMPSGKLFMVPVISSGSQPPSASCLIINSSTGEHPCLHNNFKK